MKNSLFNLLENRPFRQTLIPLFLIVSAPQMTILLPYIIVQKKGSISEAFFSGQSIGQVLQNAWSSVDWFDTECWLIVLGSLLWGLATLVLLPGKVYYGPPTRSNYRPQYWHNAVPFYLLTVALTSLTCWYCSVLHLYYKFTTIAGILNAFGVIIAALLYAKGHLAPSPGEYGSSGSPIFDFYWGLELYPQIGRYISLKVLLICRFALIFWQLVVIVAWKAAYELHGGAQWPITATSIIQTVYLAKGFYWEDGYMQSFDITFDRLGFYTFWGSITVMPTLYASHALYYVENGSEGRFGIACLALGLGSIALNYWTDYQRQIVRESDGRCTIWGRKPVLVRAKYLDNHETERTSVLLASGFWGLARHLNYFFEIVIYISTALPGLADSPIAWLLPAFVAVLLTHRTFRDDGKCAAKYGVYWREYCKLVPFKLVPGLF